MPAPPRWDQLDFGGVAAAVDVGWRPRRSISQLSWPLLGLLGRVVVFSHAHLEGP